MKIFLRISQNARPPAKAAATKSAQKHDSAGQPRDARTVDVVHQHDDVVDPIETKADLDLPAAERAIQHDDLAGPIAVDLLDHAGQRLVVKHQHAAMPGRDDSGV